MTAELIYNPAVGSAVNDSFSWFTFRKVVLLTILKAVPVSRIELKFQYTI